MLESQVKFEHKLGYKLKSDKKGIKKIIAALFFSLSGLKVCFKEEVAFRQILFICIVLGSIAVILSRDFIEWVILTLPLFFMIFAEIVNTALEKIIDLVSPDFHPLARDVKDIGSSLQFISLVFMGIIWCGYIILRFFPYYLKG